MTVYPHNSRCNEMGIDLISDVETGSERLGNLSKVTKLGRGKARISPDRPIPALALVAPEE